MASERRCAPSVRVAEAAELLHADAGKARDCEQARSYVPAHGRPLRRGIVGAAGGPNQAAAPTPSSQRNPSGAVPLTRIHPMCTPWR